MPAATARAAPTIAIAALLLLGLAALFWPFPTFGVAFAPGLIVMLDVSGTPWALVVEGKVGAWVDGLKPGISSMALGFKILGQNINVWIEIENWRLQKSHPSIT